MSRAARSFTLTVAQAQYLRKDSGAHKYDHGHAIVLSGGQGRTGAARLAARAALRVGAGLVTLAVPPDAVAETACQITAIMLRQTATPADLATLLADPRLNAICAGPGLGLGDHHAAMLTQVLTARRATVLDADALTLLARDPALRALLHPDCLLTPHDGEFARLCPDLAPPKGASDSIRTQAATAAATRLNCTLLLKGPRSIVAAPGQPCWLHPDDPTGRRAWLATAGTGDVLAGLATGLLARHLPPPQAANLAIALHSAAASHIGAGLIAEDLPDALPQVFAQLGL